MSFKPSSPLLLLGCITFKLNLTYKFTLIKPFLLPLTLPPAPPLHLPPPPQTTNPYNALYKIRNPAESKDYATRSMLT